MENTGLEQLLFSGEYQLKRFKYTLVNKNRKTILSQVVHN